MYTANVSHGLRATHTPGAQRHGHGCRCAVVVAHTRGGEPEEARGTGRDREGRGVTDLGQPGSRGREPRASPPSPSRGRGVGGVP
eukprot:7253268-Prymnesium_polylepis.1